MRKFLLVLLIVVGGLLVVADFAAKTAVGDELRVRLETEVPSSTSTSVDVDSFPFLARLLASGRVSNIRAAVTDIEAGPVRLASVKVDLHDVRIDRDVLLREQRVHLESIGSGKASAEITEEELRDALGVPVELRPGTVSVRGGPARVTGTVSIEDNVLRIKAGPLSVPALRLPNVPLLPCLTNAEVQDGRIMVSCTLDHVPPELIEAVRART